MAENTETSGSVPAGPSPGVFGRFFGVIFSPRETYTAVAARPRALGILAIAVAIMCLAQGVFLSTEVGKQAALDQNVRSMEAFGVTVTDEMYAGMEQGMSRAALFNVGSQAIFWPLASAIVAGLLVGIYTMLLDGRATFKQAFAIVAHSAVIFAVSNLFTMPLSYLRGEFAGANLSVFVPMLEETGFVTRLLSAIDLFVLWWMLSLAIGIGVLYKRSTSGIATGFFAFYAVIALVIAWFRSGS